MNDKVSPGARRQLDQVHARTMSEFARELSRWQARCVCVYVFGQGLKDIERDSREGKEVGAEYGNLLLDRYMEVLSNPDAFASTCKCYVQQHCKQVSWRKHHGCAWFC